LCDALTRWPRSKQCADTHRTHPLAWSAWRHPPRHPHAASITLARVGCKLLLDDVRASSYLFFALAALYSISTAALFVHLRLRHSLFRRHLHAATSTSPTLARRAIERSPPGSKERDSLKPAASLSFSRQAGALLSSRAVLEPCAILAILNAQQSVIVPSILALSQDFLGQGWFHVLAVLAFNVGDMLGRGPLAGYCPCPMRFVWPAVGARFAVCAAICACVPPYALSEEPLPLLLLGCTLGLTTGHLATVRRRPARRDARTTAHTLGCAATWRQRDARAPRAHHASRITHHASLITHHSSRITHHASLMLPKGSRLFINCPHAPSRDPHASARGALPPRDYPPSSG